MPVSEVISDGLNGMLVPITDHKLLAKRVVALLSNDRLRNELGFAARQTALAWDQTVMLPKLSNLVESLE